MKIPLRLKNYCVYLLYGLILHLVFFALLSPYKSKVHRPSQTIPLIVDIQKKTKSKGVIAKEDGARNRRDKTRMPSVTSSAEKPENPVQSYSSLLPKSSELTENETTILPSADGLSSSKHVWGPSLQINEKRVLLKRAGNLRALINIPLSARISLGHGKATARITRDSHFLILKILQGEPLLRAILWECLQSRSTKEAIQDIFQTLNSQEFIIALHLKEGDHIKANDDSFNWRENRLDIYASRGTRGFTPRGFHRTGGLSFAFTLPDEKADKAKEEDEDEYARLRESPAYISILSDRKL